MSMYVILWRSRPVVGQESEFERAYGPSGEWARPFRGDDGHLGTELLLRRSEDESREYLTKEYLTLDRWATRGAYEAFRAAGVGSIGDSTVGRKGLPKRRFFWAPSRCSLSASDPSAETPCGPFSWPYSPNAREGVFSEGGGCLRRAITWASTKSPPRRANHLWVPSTSKPNFR